MDETFNYNTPVGGKNLIGRKDNILSVANLLRQRENVVIASSPRMGKTSVVLEAIALLKKDDPMMHSLCVSLLSVRSAHELCSRLVNSIVSLFGSTSGDYASIVSEMLPGKAYAFDESQCETSGDVVCVVEDPTETDVRAAFELPYRLCEKFDGSIVICLEEFQNIMKIGNGDQVCRMLESVMGAYPHGRCTFVLTGSEINAMRAIFAGGRHFYRQVEHIELSMIDMKEFIDYVVKGFLSSGKVIDRDLLVGAYKLFRGHPWYLNHLCAISDSLSRGYITESMLVEALKMMVSLHEPQFRAIMNDLTTFQMNFLRAICDGNVKFSSTEVIDKYKLNSSANVKRLKEALMKKEIVWFGEDDLPVIIDPLFEYWVRNKFFEIK